MKIKFLGNHLHFDFDAEYDLPDNEAILFVAQGVAKSLEPLPVVEEETLEENE